MINEKDSTVNKLRWYLVWSSIPMSIYYTVNDVIDRQSYENLPVLLPACFLLALGFIFQKSKKILFSNLCYLSGAQIFMTYLIMKSGGLEAPGIFWFALLPVIWAMLLDKKGLIIGYASVVAIYLSFYVFQDHIHLPQHFQSYPTLFQARLENLIIFSSFVFAFIYIYTMSIKKAHKEVELKNKQVEALLKIVVHDISSPLTTALYQTQKMNESAQFEEGRSLKALQSMHKINSIITDVRNIYATTQGKKKLEFDIKNICEPIYNAVEEVRDLALKKNINISIHHEQDECLAKIDENVFKNQIILNLLTNAIKFTRPDGNIDINIKSQDRYWRIDLIDEGIGIPPELLQDIFNNNKVTSREGTAGEVGTGFGLPIAYQMTKLMNGQIYAYSPPMNPQKTIGTQMSVLVSKEMMQ